MIIFIFVLLLVILTAYVWLRRMPDCGALTAITGGVGKGKTLLSVDLSVRTFRANYRRALRKYKRALRLGYPCPELPHLYTNMPIARYGTKLTDDLILKNTRFTAKSVVYINEVSFVASSLDCKDKTRNDIWLEYFKLIRHETHGGSMIIDTQSFDDCHFSVKRSLSTVIDIIQSYNIGIGRLIHYRILDCCPDTTDADSVKRCSATHWYFVPATTYRLYDTYAYSALTDALPIEATPSTDDLKVHRDDLLLKGGNPNDKKH